MKNTKAFLTGAAVSALFLFPFALVAWLEVFNAYAKNREAAIHANNLRLAKSMMLQIERIRDNRNHPIAEDCLIHETVTRCRVRGGKFVEIQAQ